MGEQDIDANNGQLTYPHTEFAASLFDTLRRRDLNTDRPHTWRSATDGEQPTTAIAILTAKLNELIRLRGFSAVGLAVDTALAFSEPQEKIPYGGAPRAKLYSLETEARNHLLRITDEEEPEDLTDEERELRELYFNSKKLQETKSPT